MILFLYSGGKYQSRIYFSGYLWYCKLNYSFIALVNIIIYINFNFVLFEIVKTTNIIKKYAVFKCLTKNYTNTQTQSTILYRDSPKFPENIIQVIIT